LSALFLQLKGLNPIKISDRLLLILIDFDVFVLKTIMGDNLTAISGIDRQQQILLLLQQQQRVSVQALCDQFRISEATARRDLDTLATQGKVERVHGGAILITRAPPELPILERQGEQADEKQHIGRAAAALVQDNETVFLGSGSTVLEVARALHERRGLTVITNSLPIINLLTHETDLTLVSLGGMLRHSELSFIGHITEQALAEVRADKVIIGTHAISLEQGLTNDYLPETMTDRAILRVGRELIVVADHTKFESISAALLAPIERIHTLVTDHQTPQAFIEASRARGILVIQA
jgi:DeoR family transcriptional regulator, aga operon transcriptional repressor